MSANGCTSWLCTARWTIIKGFTEKNMCIAKNGDDDLCLSEPRQLKAKKSVTKTTIRDLFTEFSHQPVSYWVVMVSSI